MNIFIINSGSSSIKYQLINLEKAITLISGKVEKIGEDIGLVTHSFRNQQGLCENRYSRSRHFKDHSHAFSLIAEDLNKFLYIFKEIKISAFGHRIVHGGDLFYKPILIDQSIINKLQQLFKLAPLHNPANLAGVELCRDLFPDTPQVAVFDTAFHHDMPDYAYRYALPEEWLTEKKIRRYGFHGISHCSVAKRAEKHLARPLSELNLISFHLGNGASASAIRSGQCVDTTMGFTPLSGLMMGTRCGDIDAGVMSYLGKMSNMSFDDIDEQLNNHSGLKAICGENDMREIEALAGGGNKRAQLAIDMYCYQIIKTLGAYMAILPTVDAIIFTAGVGEHSALIRRRVCENLGHLGIQLDEPRNQQYQSGVFCISHVESPIKILIIPSNEEVEIALQVNELLKSRSSRT